MTLRQGRDINNQFLRFKDSLNSNTIRIQNTKKELVHVNKFYKDSLSTINRMFIDSLNLLHKNINLVERENIRLKNEYDRIQRQIWSDRRERRFTTIGLVFVVFSWATLFSVLR